MRTLLFCLVGLMTASSDLAFAEMKLSPKAAPGANEVRYFTSIDGLMDGNADVILKETRQGKTVTSAVLDVCYPAAEGLRPQGPLCRQSRGQRPDPDRRHPEPRRQIAGDGETGAQADRRHVRIQGADQRRPDRDRGDLDGQFRSQRKGIPGQPVDRRRHHGDAQGFYRGFSGIDCRQGEAGRGGGFPEGTEGAGRRGFPRAALPSPATRCAPASRPSTSASIRIAPPR